MPTLLYYQSLPVYIVLISIFMFVLPRISHRFYMPGSFALAILFPLVLGIYSVYGAGLYITPSMGALAAGIVFVLTISTILSDRPEMAIKHLIIYSAAVFVGVAFAGYDIWLIIIYSAIIHSVFICVPLKGKHAGLLGNSNFAGAFLAPCVFIAFHINEPLAVALLVPVLLKTRCKGALIGLTAGSIFIHPALFLVAPLVFILKYKKTFPIFHLSSYISLLIRFGMWKSSFKYMTIKRFFFGVGGDVGRILFMRDRYEKHRFRRLHSDIVQGIFDGGIFYVILYLWIGIYSITIAPPALAAALSSLMIAGFFIDTQLLHFTSVLFWLLVGQISFLAVPIVAVAPWMLPIAIIIFVLVIQTWGRAFIADAIHGIAFRHGDGKLMAFAHKIDPLDDYATASLVGAMILSKQHGPAFDRAWKLVDRYNGDLPTEIPYYLLALASFNIGAYAIAKAMARQSLVYCDHEGAKTLLGEMKKRRL